MSKICHNCQQARSADAYLCMVCGAPYLPMTRRLNAELFVRALESVGTFHTANQESRCSASLERGVYTYSIGSQRGTPVISRFTDRDSFLAFLSQRDIGGGYHESKIAEFSGHLRLCRQGLDALVNHDFNVAQERFQTALNLGFYQAEIGAAITASMSGDPEEGRRSLERMYTIYQHPQSGTVYHPLNNFFRFIGWVDAQHEGLLGDGCSTWSTPQALRQLIQWWTLLLDLKSAWSGEMYHRRGLAYLAIDDVTLAELDLKASLISLTEERARVAHIHHPHFEGEHRYYGTLFAALSEVQESAEGWLTRLRSESRSLD